MSSLPDCLAYLRNSISTVSYYPARLTFTEIICNTTVILIMDSREVILLFFCREWTEPLATF
jgi:hypothetical protein